MPDLFISYAHVDKHWVDVFVPLLEQRVNQYAGRVKPDRIWKDNRFASNVGITPEIDAQLAQAQALVSILSPGYLASEWCKYELHQFSTRVGANTGHIFYVEPDQIPLERKPPQFSQMLGTRFWRQDPLSKRTYPLHPGDREFEERLTDLAKEIATLLTTPPIPVGASSAGDSPIPYSIPVDSGESLAGQAPTGVASSPLCKRGAEGDFLQQKRAALEQRRTLLLDLLTRQQEELTFADDPKRQMKLERDIRTTQASLAQVESEIASAQFSVAKL